MPSRTEASDEFLGIMKRRNLQMRFVNPSKARTSEPQSVKSNGEKDVAGQL